MKIKESDTTGKEVKTFCNKCDHETFHLIHRAVGMLDEDEIKDNYGLPINCISWGATYQIVQCKGCNTFSYRTTSWFSEDFEGESESRYPQKEELKRLPKDNFELPDQLELIYSQTIKCFNNNILILCAAGVRAIIEGICANLGIEDGPVFDDKGEPKLKDGKPQRRDNLEGKINGLAEARIITPEQSGLLHHNRYLGNEAVHELEVPDEKELTFAINITEHIMDILYVANARDKELIETLKKKKAAKAPAAPAKPTE